MADVAWLVAHEALLVVVLGAIGAVPAVFIDRSFDGWSKVALAPVLGLCVAVCLFTTLEWFVPASRLEWLIPVLCVASLSGAFVRARRLRNTQSEVDVHRTRRGGLVVLQLLVIFIAVSFPVYSALHQNHSMGPGIYEVYDSPGYIANTDAAEHLSIHAAQDSIPPSPNAIDQHWIVIIQGDDRADVVPFTAALDGLLGVGATLTWTPFLMALLLAGGLGVYGTARQILRRSSWFAVLAGALFGGSFFIQLYFDGSQAAVAGLALIVPLAALGVRAATKPNLSSCALFALLLSGMETLYPIYIFPVIGVALCWFIVVFIARMRRADAGRLRWLRAGVGRVALTVAAAACFDLVATWRNGATWLALVRGGGAQAAQPQYHLGAGVIMGWLLEMRGFYTVAFGPQDPFADVLPALLVPLAVLLVAIPALRRNKIAWACLGFIAISCLIATYEISRQSCSYCEDRSLVPVVPAVILVICCGIGTFVGRSRLFNRLVGSAVLAVMLVFVGLSINNDRNMFATSAYFLQDSVRSAIAAVPTGSPPIEVEGFGNVPWPSPLAGQVTTYELAFEHMNGAVSYLSDEGGYGIDNSLAASPFLSRANFMANYQYIVTRLPLVKTARRTIASFTGVALEVRARPLDVTLDTGLDLPILVSQNPGGQGIVTGPLKFVVSGENHGAEYVRLDFALPAAGIALQAQKGVKFHEHELSLRVCVPATPVGAGDVMRAAKLTLPTNDNIRLTAMFAHYGHC